jgi:hypothetical protein
MKSTAIDEVTDLKRIMLGLLMPLLLSLQDCGSEEPDRSDIAFPGLVGPEERTELPLSPTPTTTLSYHSGSSDTLGIYLTDQSSSWLGLAHGFRSIGLPFSIVSDLDQALEHNVLLVYPTLTGSGTSADTLQSLAAHVRAGNTVLAFSVLGGGMPPLFGFEEALERSGLDSMTFVDNDLSRDFIKDDAEREIPLAPLSSATARTGSGLPGVSYAGTRRPPVAVYGDGSAAISHNYFETEDGSVGHAYAIGFDFGHYILRAHNGRFTEMTPDYVNAYQPKTDSLLRFIAAVYQQGEPDAVLLHPVPEGQSLAILITHDVDYTESLSNAAVYAAAEASRSVPASYFIQSKYISDYNDSRFFDVESAKLLPDLVSMGMEIASHSVAHSNEFRIMPIGTGQEQYPQYRPFVRDFTHVENASILGELRVSKFLLEQTSGQTVQAFRPGHLSLPEQLPELLAATGYRYSSSITANEALTHLPYRLMHSRGYEVELDLFEFPVTIEDEQWELQDSMPEVRELLGAIGRHGGLANVLIHTDTVEGKLDFQNALIDEYRHQAHFSTLSDFADWWQARDSVTIDSTEKQGTGRLLRLTTESALQGLTLKLPAAWRYEGGVIGSEQQGGQLVLGPFSGSAELRFSVQD